LTYFELQNLVWRPHYQFEIMGAGQIYYSNYWYEWSKYSKKATFALLYRTILN